MKIKISYLIYHYRFIITVFVVQLLLAGHANAQIYASSLDKIPPSWNGLVFQLNHNYPASLPKDSLPWKKFDYKTQPAAYMQAVLQYFVEGNDAANWIVQNNKIRKWYHAPSMAWQPKTRPYGREFIRGLTRERNSAPGELWPGQTGIVQNWAVGFYNPVGAYTFGQVWADTLKPNVSRCSFPEGTVSGKLLFTAASLTDAPYLQGSLEWNANINTNGSATQRAPQKVHLLQLDIAVKDSRNSETCWVFGTFAYNNNAPGKTIWEKMVPVGLIWGNDPGNFSGAPLKETWINPDFIRLFTFPDGKVMHTGFQGRLDGPVDNKISSCMSCHSTAQYPEFKQMVADTTNPADIDRFFRNIKCGESFDGSDTSAALDYSLQMAIGIQSAYLNRPTATHNAGNASLANASFVLTSKDDALKEPIPQQTHRLAYLLGLIALIFGVYLYFKTKP